MLALNHHFSQLQILAFLFFHLIFHILHEHRGGFKQHTFKTTSYFLVSVTHANPEWVLETFDNVSTSTDPIIGMYTAKWCRASVKTLKTGDQVIFFVKSSLTTLWYNNWKMFGHGKPHSKNLEKLHLPGLKPDSDLTLPPIRKAFHCILQGVRFLLAKQTVWTMYGL